MSYVSDIDDALQRLVDLRRTVIPNLATDPEAVGILAAIQQSLVHLVKARDQEVQLGKGTKSIFDAVVETFKTS